MRSEPFHPTELELYVYCPMKWYFTHVAKTELPYHAWAKIKGTIGHRVIESGALDQLDALWGGTISEYEASAPVQYLKKFDDEKERAELREMLTGWFDCDFVTVLEREKTITFDFQRSHTFETTIDMLATFPDTPEGTVEVLDFKFGSKFPAAGLNRKLQFMLGYLGLRNNGLTPNRYWWIHMRDFLRYKRDGKTAKKGDRKGSAFHGIKITDDDIPFITKQVLAILHEMDRIEINGGTAMQSAYGANPPCSTCEFELEHCPKLSQGTEIPAEIFTFFESRERALEQKFLNTGG